MTDFARSHHQTPRIDFRHILVDLIKVGHVRAPIAAETKLDAQAQWEANQTLPLLITLLVAGVAAVMSQMGSASQSGASIWIVAFGLCAASALARVGTSYHDAFVRALMAQGLDQASAEADFQSRYAD
jgi:hypothetical protein